MSNREHLNDWETFWFNRIKNSSPDGIYQAWLAEYDAFNDIVTNSEFVVEYEESKLRCKIALQSILQCTDDDTSAYVVQKIQSLFGASKMTNVFSSFLFDELVTGIIYDNDEKSQYFYHNDQNRLLNFLITKDAYISSSETDKNKIYIDNNSVRSGLMTFGALKGLIFNYRRDSYGVTASLSPKYKTLDILFNFSAQAMVSNMQWQSIISRDILTYEALQDKKLTDLLLKSNLTTQPFESANFFHKIMSEAAENQDIALFKTVQNIAFPEGSSAEDLLVLKTVNCTPEQKRESTMEVYTVFEPDSPEVFFDKLTTQLTIDTALSLLNLTPMRLLPLVTSEFTKQALLNRVATPIDKVEKLL